MALETFQIYKNLASLNGLNKGEAQTAFMSCCGSTEWATRMADARPFKLVEDLYRANDAIWFSLTPADWFEAFSRQPQMASTKVKKVGTVTSNELEMAKRLYENKFGFIFIAYAEGKGHKEMLKECRTRFENTRPTELQIAAEEQRKINESGLNKLLEQ